MERDGTNKEWRPKIAIKNRPNIRNTGSHQNGACNLSLQYINILHCSLLILRHPILFLCTFTLHLHLHLHYIPTNDCIQTVQTYTHTSSSRHWCPRGSRCSRSGSFAGCRWQRCRCLRNCCHLQITFKLNARWWPKSRKHNARRQRPRRAARTTGRYVDDRRSAYFEGYARDVGRSYIIDLQQWEQVFGRNSNGNKTRNERKREWEFSDGTRRY